MTTSAKFTFLRETYKKHIAELLLSHIEDAALPHLYFPCECGTRLPQLLISMQEKINFEEPLRDYDYNLLFREFAKSLDPTAHRNGGKAYKYLHWICPQFLAYRHNGKPMLIEDFKKHFENLRDFDSWSARLAADGKPNQIDDPALSDDGFSALTRLVRPYQHHREEKRLKNAFRRLTPAQKQDIEDNTTTLYSGAEGRVLMIHSWEAAKFWGTHTEWCITYKDTSDHFENYQEDSPIIFYLPQPEAEDFKNFSAYTSFKFAAVEGDLYDELDNTVKSNFPECLHRLACAFSKCYDQECRPFIEEQALAACIVNDVIAPTPLSQAKQNATCNEDIDYDDFDQVVAAMKRAVDVDSITNLASDRLRRDPEFMLAGLDIEGRIRNTNTLPTANAISQSQEFMDRALEDREFLKRAIKTASHVLSVLPRALQEDEDLRLCGLEKNAVYITSFLKKIAAKNPDNPKAAQLGYLSEAMIINPSVVDIVSSNDLIELDDIPDRAWLDMLDAHPYALVVSLETQKWFKKYCMDYSGDTESMHSPRNLVLKACASYEDQGALVIGAFWGGLFSLLSRHHPHSFYDPEILTACVAQDMQKFLQDDIEHIDNIDHIMLQAFKKNVKNFKYFTPAQREKNLPLMREALRHVIETGQEEAFSGQLRFLPFLPKNNPLAMMSCQAALEAIDTLLPADTSPWPDFQDIVDAYRQKQNHMQSSPSAAPKRSSSALRP